MSQESQRSEHINVIASVLAYWLERVPDVEAYAVTHLLAQRISRDPDNPVSLELRKLAGEFLQTPRGSSNSAQQSHASQSQSF